MPGSGGGPGVARRREAAPLIEAQDAQPRMRRQLDRRVGRVVHHDHLNAGEALSQRALHGATDLVVPVARRDHHRQARAFVRHQRETL